MTRTRSLPEPIDRQQGAASVEFALCSTVFFIILLGAMEFGRILWTWNAATEATRYGARLAVVCDKDAQFIRTQIQSRLPTPVTPTITLTYLPTSCAAGGATPCQLVTVTLSNYTLSSFIPFVSVMPTLPPFTTTLSREGMSSSGNPACS